MTSEVVIFPGVRPRDSGKPRAQLLAERLTCNFGTENVVDVTDALCRVTAAICLANTVNVTDAIGLAHYIGADIEALVREAYAPGAGSAGGEGA